MGMLKTSLALTVNRKMCPFNSLSDILSQTRLLMKALCPGLCAGITATSVTKKEFANPVCNELSVFERGLL